MAMSDKKRFLGVSGSEDDGQLVGVDPRKVLAVDWYESELPLNVGLKAIRQKCLDCAHSTSEVLKCVCFTCPLWPLRRGTVSKAFREAREQREAEREKSEQPEHLRRENWSSAPSSAQGDIE